MTNERDIWERQASDTDKSYQAFCVYRDMGRERSLEQVGQELGKSKAILERWSSKHDWVARVSAYDEHLDRLQRQAYEDSIVAGRVSHVQGMVARCETMMEKLDTAIRQAHSLQNASGRETTQTLDDGTIIVTKFPVFDSGELIRLTKWMADLDTLVRRQYEMPDKYTQQKIETETPRSESWEQALRELADEDNGDGW